MTQEDHQQNFITVVSGFARSGTSLMMGALEAGGLAVLKDDEFKPPNEHNPRGYFECKESMLLGVEEERVARWLKSSRNKAVKVMIGFLHHLPTEHHYRILLMKRKPEEMFASWKAMAPERVLGPHRNRELRRYKDVFRLTHFWLEHQKNMEFLVVDFNTVVARPEEEMKKVRSFLGLSLNIEKMSVSVDPGLYRNRRAGAGSP
jgi:hypothetical protein